MGAYLPVTLGDPAHPGASAEHTAAMLVIVPTLREMARRDRPFQGLLYAGLMITRDGPKVVEFNCRFGDPETQALMPLLDAWPLLPMLRAVAEGRPLCGQPVDEVGAAQIERTGDAKVAGAGLPPVSGACVTTVLAAANYPETPRTGDPITLPPIADDSVTVFHAGTARDAQGRLVTAGGRVLAVSAVAPTIAQAQRNSLAYAERIEFAGKQYRTDIGWREIARQRHPGARAPRD